MVLQDNWWLSEENAGKWQISIFLQNEFLFGDQVPSIQAKLIFRIRQKSDIFMQDIHPYKREVWSLTFFLNKSPPFSRDKFYLVVPILYVFAIPQVYTYKKLALTSWGEFRWWFVQWFNANVTRIERVSASQSDPLWDKLSEIEQSCRMWKDKIELFKKSYPLKNLGF